MTSRPGCSIRQRKTANTFGFKTIRCSPRPRHSLAKSKWNGGKKTGRASDIERLFPRSIPQKVHEKSTQCQEVWIAFETPLGYAVQDRLRLHWICLDKIEPRKGCHRSITRSVIMLNLPPKSPLLAAFTIWPALPLPCGLLSILMLSTLVHRSSCFWPAARDEFWL